MLSPLAGLIGTFERRVVEEGWEALADALAEKTVPGDEYQWTWMHHRERKQLLWHLPKHRDTPWLWNNVGALVWYKPSGSIVSPLCLLKVFGLWAAYALSLMLSSNFSPLADVVLIGLYGNAFRFYYLIFLMIDAGVSIHEASVCGFFCGFQRSSIVDNVLRPLFRSYLKAIKGELQAWGRIEGQGMA